MKSQKQAFTLIEMLVVIAIIALLASLIISGVSKAKERAYAIKTLANLKQLHLANQQHALQYKGFYVPHRLDKPEDSDNPDTYWLDNNHFTDFLYSSHHNGWDDWPSYLKTGSPNANLKNTSPKGVISKMSLGICLGGFNSHWQEGAFNSIQLAAYPRMIMFADSASWLIYGSAAERSPRTYDDSVGASYGTIAFRYNGKAGVIRISGDAAMVRYETILPRSEHPEIWPDIRPQPFDFYD